MSGTAVHQFVPTFERGAVCSHALAIEKTLREAGHESNIYAEFIRDDMAGLARPLTEHANVSGDQVAIYHMAVGSNVADYLRRRRDRLVLNHHNLTPLEYLEPWEPSVSYGVQWGFRQLRELAPRTELAIAVSSFNEEELRAVGYRQTTVVPILFDTETFAREPDEKLTRELMDRKERGEAIWLFVGRLSPNKCQHDIIKAFAYYRQVINPNAHLYLVGGSSSHAYEEALNQFIETAGVRDYVTMTGTVSDAELSAYYKQSSVFVCLSEHEGFCVPLLEAFYNELPIVAFRSTAIPETLGDAGLLLSDKTPAMVASAVDSVISNPELAAQLKANGKRRLSDFDLEKTKQSFLAALEKVGVS